MKKREDELGTVIAQMQFEKAKPVSAFIYDFLTVVMKFGGTQLIALCTFGSETDLISLVILLNVNFNCDNDYSVQNDESLHGHRTNAVLVVLVLVGSTF